MARLADLKKGQWDQFDRLLNSTDLTAEEVLMLIEHPKLLKNMLIDMRTHPRFVNPATLVHGLFIRPQLQIERVHQWNRELSWGIPEDEFSEITHSIPNWPEEKSVAVVLVPYLEAKEGMSGIKRTFAQLWSKLQTEFKDKTTSSSIYENVGPDVLRLRKGLEHPATSKGHSTLRWEVIDFTGVFGVKDPEVMPHAGVLACAMLNPQWIYSLFGKKRGGKAASYALPGYEVDFCEWSSSPLLVFRIEDDGEEVIWRTYDPAIHEYSPTFYGK